MNDTATTVLPVPPTCDIHGCNKRTKYSILIAGWAGDGVDTIAGYCDECAEEKRRRDGFHLLGEVDHE